MQPQIKNAVEALTSTAKNINTDMDNNLTDLAILRKALLKISENIFILNTDLSPDLYTQIIQENTFINPKYESNVREGRSNWQTSRTLETYTQKSVGLYLPRGYISRLLKLSKNHGTDFEIEDARITNPVSFPPFKKITLRQYQQEAIDKALQHSQGVIVAPTGSGKSLIGLELIRQKEQRALILVHRVELAKQWIKTIKEYLGLKAGLIGNGHWKIGNKITVAMVQTLQLRETESKTLLTAFGTIICDEVHHTPCETFYEVLGRFPAKFRYGLSATPSRRDGLEMMIYRAVGSKIATLSREETEGIGATVPPNVITIRTNCDPGNVNSWHEYLDVITQDADRNQGIINLAQQDDSSVLILTDRVTHAEHLSEMLTRREIDHVLAHGQIGKKDRETMMGKIKSAHITVGTTGLLGEGLDVSSWGVLIMATPISSEIKLMQAIGRTVRPAKNKENALIYDLKDDCGFAGSSFNKRFEIYKKNRIQVRF